MPVYLPMLLSTETVVELKRLADDKDGPLSDETRKELRNVTTESLRRNAPRRRAA